MNGIPRIVRQGSRRLRGHADQKGEGRRLIKQNGLTLNDAKVTDENYVLQDSDFTDGAAIVKKGKKKFYKLANA